MEDNNNNFDRFERYLRGEMESTEATSFEKEIEENARLRSQFKVHQAADNLILERRLQKVRGKAIQHSKSDTQSAKALIYGSGLVLTLALVGTVVFYTTSVNMFDETELSNDSIIIESAQRDSQNSDLRRQIVSQDSSAYDTLIKDVKARNKTPESRVDDIYNEVNEIYQEDSITETIDNDRREEQKLASPSDSLLQKDTTTIAPEDNPCSDTRIEYNIQPEKTCFEQSDGAIDITVSNGTLSNFSIKIKDINNQNVQNHNLSKGKYTVQLVNRDGCKSEEKRIYIDDKLCLKDYLINTGYGQSLVLPETDPYSFTVLDRNGNIYYSQDVKNKQALEWDGKGNDGSIKPGYYIIKVITEENTVKKGSVTIKN